MNWQQLLDKRYRKLHAEHLRSSAINQALAERDQRIEALTVGLWFSIGTAAIIIAVLLTALLKDGGL